MSKIYMPKTLTGKLSEIHNYPLTFAEAGSGFGKTTAISFFLSGTDAEKHWYTCFGEPADKAWRNICALLGYADAVTAARLQKITQPDKDSLGAIALLMDEFSCERLCFLVIDNYHMAGFERPFDLLRALGAHNCGLLHIIVLSQPLNSVAEQFHNILSLRQNDFCFDVQSIERYFRNAGVKLTDEEASGIYNATEGWVAALRLHLQQHTNEKYPEKIFGISELINAAIWNPLSEDERRALLKLCVFPCFTPGLAALALETEELQPQTRSLLSRVSLIRRSGETFTFHALLRDNLLNRLDDIPNLRRESYKKAAAAYASMGDNISAAAFFVKSGNPEEALKLRFTLSEVNDLALYSCEETLAPIFSLPEEIILKYPEKLLIFALSLFFRGEPLFGRLYEIIRNILSEDKYISGQREVLNFFLAFNDISIMGACLKRALELLGENQPILYMPTSSWSFGTPSAVSLYWRENLEREFVLFEQEIFPYYKLTQNHGYGAHTAFRADMLLLSGNDGEAEPLCYKAVYQSSQYRQESIAFCAEFTLARIALLRGKPEEYASLRDEIKNRGFDGFDEETGLLTADICLAFLDCIVGRTKEIPPWLSDIRSVRSHVFGVTSPFCGIILALALLRSDTARFRAVIGELLAEAEQQHMLLPKLYYLLLLTIDRSGAGEMPEAWEYFRKALEIALPNNVLLPFAELYDELKPFIRHQELHHQELHDLGRRMSKGLSKIRATYNAPTGLTQREREIALLAQRRLSVKEISGRLYIAESTVKSTMQRVYVKLGIHKRSELENIKI